LPWVGVVDQDIGYHLPTVINQVSIQVGGGDYAWHARRHPPDPELAKEQALRVNTKTATKMQMDPELAKEQALRVNAKKATKLQMDPELAKEQALRVNAKKATKMQTEPELECTALCIQCTYETPQSVSELPMWLLELHWASPHSCTPPTDMYKIKE
jgi:hypothetical protein